MTRTNTAPPRPVNILVESTGMIPSVQVGVLDTLSPLAEQGRVKVCFRCTSTISKEDIAWCDALISVRGATRISLEILRAAREAGRYTLYFLDDDLLHVPEGLSCSAFFHSSRTKKAIIGCIGLCDALWCVNPLNLEKYASYCKGDAVFCCPSPSVLADDLKTSEEGPVRVLFAGGIDHVRAVRKYVAPILPRLCEDFGAGVDFLFLGVDPDMKKLEQVHYRPYIDDIELYRKSVLEGGFSLGLAVVEDESFFHCKYISKYFEYTRMGALGVYSGSMPYTRVIRDGENGFLCVNTPESWYNTLKHAISIGAADRSRMFNAAAADIRRNYSPALCAQRLLENAPGLQTFACARKPEDIGLRSLKKIHFIDRAKELWEENKLTFLPRLIYKTTLYLIKR